MTSSKKYKSLIPLLSDTTRYIYSIIFFFSIIIILKYFGKSFSFHFLLKNSSVVVLSNNSIGSSLIKLDSIVFQVQYTINQSRLSKFLLPIYLTFSIGKVYHHAGIAYDYYSKNDFKQLKPGRQWRIWPLPNEINQNSSFNHTQISPFVISKLPFIDEIYVLTNPRLKERHINLKKAFNHQGISIESIKWRMKWNFTTCNSNSTNSYVYQRLNLKDKPLSNFILTLFVFRFL
jgi:hypothetical protein